MVNYRIVKYCRTCKARYLIDKGEKMKNHCDACQKKYGIDGWGYKKDAAKGEEEK